MKRVIINADDFGMTPLYNKAILELLWEGWATSTSVMMSRMSITQQDDVLELKKLRASHYISIWLHIEFFDTRFDFHIQRQLQWFIDVFDHLPDHIDLHANTYKEDGYPYVAKTALELWIPCRYYEWLISDDNKTTQKKISWSRITVDEIVSEIQQCDDVDIEVILHRGYMDDRYITSMQSERVDDIDKCHSLKIFCETQWIELINYRDIC